MSFLRYKDRPAEGGASDQALAAAALAPLSASTAAPRSGKLLHAGHQDLPLPTCCADYHCMCYAILEALDQHSCCFSTSSSCMRAAQLECQKCSCRQSLGLT